MRFLRKDLKITPTLKVSSFSKIQRKSLIKSNKIKVLVLPHDFFDAPHAWGNKGIFPDYFKWLEFIKKMAKITNYDWYIKTHPNFIGQYGDNQKKSRELVKKMFFGIKNLKILPPNYSHDQIIKEKIDLLISCHGSSLYEYSYKGITSLASSNSLPWNDFKICIVPKDINDLKEKIINIRKTKNNFKVNKNEILDYFYLRFGYYKNSSWLLPFKKYCDFVGGWHKRQSMKIFEFWMKEFNNIIVDEKKKFIRKKILN